MTYPRFIKRLLRSDRGFTLIELLVIISIMGALAAIVTLNVVGYITAGTQEAFKVEQKHVHDAVGIYLFEGNTISSAVTVGPGDLGILSPWLIGSLQYYWQINTDGSVTNLLYASSLGTLSGLTTTDGSWTSDGDSITSDGTESSLVVTDGSYEDFTVSTTVDVSGDDGFGIYYCSDSDASDGYVLVYDASTGTLTVYTVVNGVKTTAVASTSVSSMSGSQSVSVSVTNGSHSVSVNGSTLMSFTDSTYTSGTVGLLATAGSNASFTSFTVSPP